MKIKVVGVDPSTSNFGIALAAVDIETGEFDVEDLILICTEPETKKGVRKDSDDLRRAKIVHDGFIAACEGRSFVMAEIPYCDPRGYAGANFNSGLVTGVLAGCPLPLIQVFPQESKQLFVGSRHAAKEEMIEEAMRRFPTAPWLMRKLKGRMVPTKANEHLSDAVAAINAGIKSTQFQEAIAMFKAMKAA
ncbi:hypothetical protein [Castellaniella sp.]|uniref:hypothetical protein n=1 Tax=Castellaniella sp. TaxID=1955812 RepID=UPI002AFF19B8|nr:hypothetical protein [Castellaniella sp.]